MSPSLRILWCGICALSIAYVLVIAAVFLIILSRISGAEAAPGRLCGEASYYGTESGSRTATGEFFNGTSMTAAMRDRSLFGRHVQVTRVSTGKSVVVRINDYGPAKSTGRIIDLAKAAGNKLGILTVGHDKVCLEVLP